MKRSSIYVCQTCGAEASRWFGRCAGCGAWNTCVEEGVSTRRTKAGAQARNPPTPITAVSGSSEARQSTGIGEFDRALGGGIVEGSAILIGGDPGIGKSTLLLQASSGVALSGSRVLYVSAEESLGQTKMRAQRVGALSENLLVASETDVEAVCEQIASVRPVLVVVDSIQTLYRPDLESAPGSVSQVRECASRLVSLAKTTGAAVFLIGHVTKEGSVAGPRTLEHLVDTVLYLEGERHGAFRILRAAKNRFGSTNEIGIFEMQEKGLTEVRNPSRLFIPDRTGNGSGSVVVCSMEGTRPLLVELQALVARTAFGYPQRVTTGIDGRRLAILVAVLEKRSGLDLSAQDIFLNAAGGVRLDEPAVDLGVALAVVSSFRDRPVDRGLVAIGEVGLGGEVRPVGQVDRRVAEAHQLGFTRCVVAKENLRGLKAPSGLEVVGVAQIDAAQEVVFG
ncbi:MAG: DNA repair protein RadA [Candidatus Latescibacteria bacterium]|nr:DNA repair protein RadA [Candidatus Latescibacterota bacterium]